MSSILMSASNPAGMTLEALLEQVATEINAKSDRIRGDMRPEAQHVLNNNTAIVALLKHARELQLDSLRVLATLGPNQGPTGTPRVGTQAVVTEAPQAS